MGVAKYIRIIIKLFSEGNNMGYLIENVIPFYSNYLYEKNTVISYMFIFTEFVRRG